MPMNIDAEIFWDKQAVRFDKSQDKFESASREIISRTKDFLNPDDNVLDFGCATGAKTLELAGDIRHIRGLDISSEMISLAIKKLNAANLKNVSFSNGTIFKDDLEKASFDKILAYSIIQLLADSEKVIQRINELLKPGGLFISETPCFRERMNFRTRLKFTSYRFLKRLGVLPLQMNMLSASDVSQLISSQDFNILRNEKLFLNGMTISFIVAKKAES
ncbi:MAG: class I SAM-dependent methyltransferase [Bacteroidales bacterium]|jgi:ubiquinone/menaquinone biosynthesis C-methylase UbiE|nr:class I SAM-dependent methyltransferase [Bacteroidales bacterium]